MGISNNIEFTAYVGIDWVDKKHDACVQAAQSNQREIVVIPHQVDRIDEGVRILYRCWQTRQPYNESIYLKALEKRGSNLVKQPA